MSHIIFQLIAGLIAGVPALCLILAYTFLTPGYFFTSQIHPNVAFLAILAFRYTRLFLNCIAYFCYRPSRVRDIAITGVAVIVPTVSPDSPGFAETIVSICRNSPAAIIIPTVGQRLATIATDATAVFRRKYPNIVWDVLHVDQANKRRQIATAAHRVNTPLICLVDDGVVWGPNFLQALANAFEDPQVTLVGTNKRVRTTTRNNPTRFLPLESIFNFFGSTYLARHNFEIRATNTIDGGVFVVSGRTMGIRTEFFKSEAVMNGYLNERAFGQLLLPDDDNYLTRQVVKAGLDIKIEYTPSAEVEIVAQFQYPRFFSQCLRWARSTFRSNVTSLCTDAMVWRRHPWSVYAVYFTGLVNFALFNDGAMIYLLSKSDYSVWLPALVAWILVSKLIKLVPYFARNPRDLVFFPTYVFFAYLHSFIKLFALITVWSVAWSGRDLDTINEYRPFIIPGPIPPYTAPPAGTRRAATPPPNPPPRTSGLNPRAGSLPPAPAKPWA